MSNPMFESINAYLDQCVERLASLQGRIDNLNESGLDTDTQASALRNRAEQNELMLAAIYSFYGAERAVEAIFTSPFAKIVRSSSDFALFRPESTDGSGRGYFQVDTRLGSVEFVPQGYQRTVRFIAYEDTYNSFDINPLVFYAGNKEDGDGVDRLYPEADQGKTGRLTINKRGAKGMFVPFDGGGALGTPGVLYWLHIELDAFNFSPKGSFSIYTHQQDKIFHYFSDHFDGTKFVYGKDERDGIRKDRPIGIRNDKFPEIKAMIVSGISDQLSDNMIIAPDRALKNTENTLIDLTMPLASNIDRVTDVNVTRITNTGYLYSVLYATTDSTNPWKLAVFMLDTVDMTRRGVSAVIEIGSPSTDINSSESMAYIRTVGMTAKPESTRLDYILDMRASGTTVDFIKTLSLEVVTDPTGAPSSITNNGVSTLISATGSMSSSISGDVLLVGQIKASAGTDAVYELISISSLGSHVSTLITINDTSARQDLSMGTYATRDMQFSDVIDSKPVLDDSKAHDLSGMDPYGYIYGYSKTNPNTLVRYPTRSVPEYTETINDVWYDAPQKVDTNAGTDAKLFTGGGTDCIALVYPDGIKVYRYPVVMNRPDQLTYANQLDYGWSHSFNSPIGGIKDVVFLNIPEDRNASVLFAILAESSIAGYDKLYLCEIGTNNYDHKGQGDESPIVILDAIDIIEGSMVRGQQFNKGGKPLVTVIRKDGTTLVTHVYQAYQSGGKYSWLMVF